MTVIRSGVIEGIVVEIAHETRNGERLDFLDGFQRGGLQVLADHFITINLNPGRQAFCYIQGCDFSAYGDILNLVIEGAGTNELINVVASAIASTLHVEGRLSNFQTTGQGALIYSVAEGFGDRISTDRAQVIRAAASLFAPDPELQEALNNGDQARVDEIVNNTLSNLEINFESDPEIIYRTLAPIFGFTDSLGADGTADIDLGDFSRFVSDFRQIAGSISDQFEGTAAGALFDRLSRDLNNGEVVFSIAAENGSSYGVRLGSGRNIEIVQLNSDGTAGDMVAIASQARTSPVELMISMVPDAGGSIDVSFLPEGLRNRVNDAISEDLLVNDTLINTVPVADTQDNRQLVRIFINSENRHLLTEEDQGAIYIERTLRNGDRIYSVRRDDGSFVSCGNNCDVAVSFDQVREQVRVAEEGRLNREANFEAARLREEHNRIQLEAIEQYREQFPQGELTDEDIRAVLDRTYEAAAMRAHNRRTCNQDVCESTRMSLSEQQANIEYLREFGSTPGQQQLLRQHQAGIAAADAGYETLNSFNPLDPLNLATTVVLGAGGVVVRVYRNGRVQARVLEGGTFRGGSEVLERGWNRIDEVSDPNIPLQFAEEACGGACAERLTGVSQRMFGSRALEPDDLADLMNRLDNSTGANWIGGAVNVGDGSARSGFEALNALDKPWIAQFTRNPSEVGHYVVVNGLDNSGRVIIQDPAAATRYLMNVDDFLEEWQFTIAVFGR